MSSGIHLEGPIYGTPKMRGVLKICGGWGAIWCIFMTQNYVHQCYDTFFLRSLYMLYDLRVMEDMPFCGLIVKLCFTIFGSIRFGSIGKTIISENIFEILSPKYIFWWFWHITIVGKADGHYLSMYVCYCGWLKPLVCQFSLFSLSPFNSENLTTANIYL